MATSDPIDILLNHNHWANRQIIDACRRLTDEQFHQRFEMGPGSLHDAMVHVAGAMRGWTDLLARREFAPRPEGQRFTAEELSRLLEDRHADLSAHARTEPLGTVMARERGGKTYHFTRGAILCHVTTHGMHHRAQCLNMLRHIGVNPLPPSSVMEWTMMSDGQ